MSELIDKEVYIEVRENSYGYSSNLKWQKGKIVGVFLNGDVLVQYKTDDLARSTQEDIAFIKSDRIIKVTGTWGNKKQ